MSYCCVAHCNKKQGGTLNGESDFRRFIRWYRFPKKKAMQKKWVARVLRRISDVHPESMYVCSEHFEDDDFVYRNLLEADMFSGELLVGHHIKLKDDAVPNTDRKTGLLRAGRPIATKAIKRTHDDISQSLAAEQAEPSSSSSMTRGTKRVRGSMDMEDIEKLIDQNQSIVGSFPDEMEVLVDEPIVEILEASHKDKAVQHSLRSKSKQTQIGGLCNSLDNSSYLNDLETSGSESDVDKVDDDPDYTPINPSTSKELDFSRNYSFKRKKMEKMTHVTFPISKIIGK